MQLVHYFGTYQLTVPYRTRFSFLTRLLTFQSRSDKIDESSRMQKKIIVDKKNLSDSNSISFGT